MAIYLCAVPNQVVTGACGWWAFTALHRSFLPFVLWRRFTALLPGSRCELLPGSRCERAPISADIIECQALLWALCSFYFKDMLPSVFFASSGRSSISVSRHLTHCLLPSQALDFTAFTIQVFENYNTSSVSMTPSRLSPCFPRIVFLPSSPRALVSIDSLHTALACFVTETPYHSPTRLLLSHTNLSKP